MAAYGGAGALNDEERGAVPEESPLLVQSCQAHATAKTTRRKNIDPQANSPQPSRSSFHQLWSTCSVHSIVCFVAFSAVVAFLLAKDLIAYWFTRSSVTGVVLSFSNDYPPLETNYPWTIVEPSVATTLTAKGVSTSVYCVWLIEWVEEQWDKETRHSGCGSFVHVFEGAPREYTVTLRLSQSGQALSSEEITQQVMCKYVRRELRSLTTVDRERYFSALEKVHRLSAEDGIQLYGDAFKNYEYFTAKHLDATKVNECFPYVGPFHGSNAFLTAHAAFTLELEQALQAVDPAISQPYWDFTKDSSSVLGDTWASSELFGYEYFGPAAPSAGHTLNNSRWFTNLPLATAAQDSELDGYVVYNGYGTLTNVVNEDNTLLVTRGGAAVCGWPTPSALPSYTSFVGCSNGVPLGAGSLEQRIGLTAWRSCLENEVHAYIHSSLGGAWECPQLLTLNTFGDSRTRGEADSSTEANERRTFLALNAVNIWKVALANGLLACPTEGCSRSTASFGACSCSCTGTAAGSRADRATLADSEVLEELVKSRVLDFLVLPAGASGVFTSNSNENDGSGDVFGGGAPASFVGLGTEANNNAFRDLLDLTCAPGKLGTLATDAAANDPAFWALHVLYDRAWHEGRRAGTLEDDWTTTTMTSSADTSNSGGSDDDSSSGSDASLSHRQRSKRRTRRRQRRRMDSSSSIDTEECFGTAATDVLPFAFQGANEVLTFDPDEVDSGEELSNAALVAFFDPANEALPYVYATFDF